jgi:hypothetical protein
VVCCCGVLTFEIGQGGASQLQVVLNPHISLGQQENDGQKNGQPKRQGRRVLYRLLEFLKQRELGHYGVVRRQVRRAVDGSV